MKKLVFLFVVCCISNIAFSQNLKFSWLNQISTVGYSYVDLCFDKKQDIISGGSVINSGKFYFKNTETNYTSKGKRDCFIQKITPEGDLVWLKTFGSDNDETLISIANDDNQDIISVGLYKGDLAINPDDPNYVFKGLSKSNGFVQKLDSTGKFIWGVNMTSLNSSIIPVSVTTDKDNNVYLCGNFRGTITLDGLLDSIYVVSQSTYSDGFLLKLNPDGKCLWIRTFGNSTTYSNSATHVAIHKDTLICVGNFEKEVNFGSQSMPYLLQCNTGSNIYVCKYTSTNRLVFAKSIGGNAAPVPTALHIDKVGNISIAGDFQGKGDFDPGSSETILSAIDEDHSIFLLQLSFDGIFLYAAALPTFDPGLTPKVSGCFAISTDNDMNVYIGGIFTKTTDFNPDPDSTNFYQSEGETDMYIAKISKTFKLDWVHQFSNNSLTGDIVTDIIIDKNDNIFYSGIFDGITDFAPGDSINNILSKGSFTGFICQWKNCNPTLIIDTFEVCKYSTFKMPDGVILSNIESDTNYTFIKSEKNSCDTTFNIHLKVIETESKILVNSDTIESINSGDKYQWLDCDKNYKPIFGETKNYFIPQKSGEYALELDNFGCKDTSDCVSFIITNNNTTLQSDNLKLYPNPFYNILNIECPEDECFITLIDINGNLVHKSKLMMGVSNIDLGELEAGFYILSIKNKDQYLINQSKLIKGY